MKKIENEKALLKSALDYEQIQMFNEKKRIYKKAEKPKVVAPTVEPKMAVSEAAKAPAAPTGGGGEGIGTTSPNKEGKNAPGQLPPDP